LGEDEARQLFTRVARRPKRGRGKALAADRDHRLLKAHDEGIQRGDSIAKIAKQLRADGIELGNTAEAINNFTGHSYGACKSSKGGLYRMVY
jgi:hypothetical protein